VEDILAYILREQDGRIVDGKIEGAPHLLPNISRYSTPPTSAEPGNVYPLQRACADGRRAHSFAERRISKTVNLPGKPPSKISWMSI
jgi:hypothetical protein